MKRLLVMLTVLGLVLSPCMVQAQEAEQEQTKDAEDVEVIFSFEKGLQGWDIPNWAYEKPDHVQQSIQPSPEFASEGDQSLKMMVAMPGKRWAGAIVEVMQYFDWSDYNKVACDIYLPADAPEGLKAKMILTVGDSWKWVEMSRSYNLTPGEWSTLEGDLTPGSIDWRRVQVDDAFRQDVRKIDIRIHSNRPEYSGPIYIDNVRVTN